MPTPPSLRASILSVCVIIQLLFPGRGAA